jgi:pimeloyl-ACP methyl ester carboxylesterase
MEFYPIGVQQMRTKHLTTVDGFQIATAVTPGPGDMVIWMHGISVNKDEFLNFFRDGAQFLNQQARIASIRFDFRGHGESSGKSLDFSIIGQNIDSNTIVDFARKEIGRSSRRLHIIAASFGAPPAIFAAIRYPEIIRTVCLISPVISYRRTFLQPETPWAAKLFSEDKLKKLEKTGRLYLDEKFTIGPRLLEEMYVIRPDLALRDITQPVLVLHGDRDSMVPFASTVEACRNLPRVKLRMMRGVDHGFMIEGDEEGRTPASIANKESIYQQLLDHIR